MKITVIIPTYNEAGTIGALLDALQKVFESAPQYLWSILVVDSNSPDGTAVVVEERARRYKSMHLLKQAERRGLGSAYVLGMRYAVEKLGADAFVECDADFQHDPRDIPRLAAELMNGYDYIIGSRYVPGGAVPQGWPLSRKLLSKWGSWFIRTVLRVPVRDATSGLKMTRVVPFTAHSPLSEDAIYSRFIPYKIHLLYAMHAQGARIKEIPIVFGTRTRGVSKSVFRDVLETLKVVFMLWYKGV